MRERFKKKLYEFKKQTPCSRYYKVFTAMPIPQLLHSKTAASIRTYCFTGIPHSQCSQKKTPASQMPIRSFCVAKLPRASELTVLQGFHIHDARTPNSPQVAKSMLH